MKYTVTFSCGHEATVDLFGKTSERERRITWYEKEGICPDCYRRLYQGRRQKSRCEATRISFTAAAQLARAHGGDAVGYNVSYSILFYPFSVI
mgnify:FL=1